MGKLSPTRSPGKLWGKEEEEEGEVVEGRRIYIDTQKILCLDVCCEYLDLGARSTRFRPGRMYYVFSD